MVFWLTLLIPPGKTRGRGRRAGKGEIIHSRSDGRFPQRNRGRRIYESQRETVENCDTVKGSKIELNKNTEIEK